MRCKLGVAMLLALVLTVATLHDGRAQTVVDFESFTGAGFAPSPSAGQLDSDEWIVTGLSDGGLAFGDTGGSGDFARGSSNGHVTTGGVYAFNTGSNTILGVQPGGSDFTPGAFVFRWTNNTGDMVTALDIEYDIWHYNDQGRANSLNFAYSTDANCAPDSFVEVPDLNFITDEAADAVPIWSSVNLSTTVPNLNIAVAGTFCLQWTGDDVSGGGSRDEYGIDNVAVTPATPNLVELVSFSAQQTGSVVVLDWETAVEIDSAGFNVYRRVAGKDAYIQLNPMLVAAQAAAHQGASYQMRDRPGDGHFEYILEDVDTRGRTTRHGPVQVRVGSARATQSQRLYLPFIAGR